MSDVPSVMPVVSVIMPAHNAAATLARAFESLTRQTLPAWEAVVVDDGSTDATWHEIVHWMTQDARIRGIRLARNQQAPAASNRALAAAKGTWIAVLDADDWIVPDRLKSLVAIAEARGADVVADNQILYDAQAGTAVGTVLPSSASVEPLTLQGYVAHCITGVSRFDYGMMKPLVRREFLVRAGVHYEEACVHGYDFHFMLDLLAAGARAAVVHEPMYVYVQPYGTVSRRLSHATRTRYRYDIMQRHTDRAIERYSTSLDRRTLDCLGRRSRAIVQYAAYLEFRDALVDRRWWRAAMLLTRCPALVQPAWVSLLDRLGLHKRAHRISRPMPAAA